MDMLLLVKVQIVFIALLHLYFMWLEMFAWTSRAKYVFKNFRKDFFEETKVLAANQGLYNGFLAAGLIWTFFIENAQWNKNISIFFLSCVAIAGIYGAITADRKIFFIQALPALIALLFLFIFE